jgi:hypothetical protein
MIFRTNLVSPKCMNIVYVCNFRADSIKKLSSVLVSFV